MRTPLCLLALAFLSGCGAPAEPPAAERLGQSRQQIVGGTPDRETSGVVALALDLQRGGLIGHCSGTLIAPNLVLTAHHCVALTSDDDTELVDCEQTRFTQQIPARNILVSGAAVRPASAGDASFRRAAQVRTQGDSRGLCGLDIALLVLEGGGFPASVQPITPRLERAPERGERFSVLGYGLTSADDESSSGTRQRADEGVVFCSREDCVDGSGGAIRGSEWASLNAPVCAGDSGGPALDGDGQVFGVASRGDVDCEIAVYSDTSSFAQFIADTAVEAAALGSYTAPAWATRVSSLEPGDPGVESSASSPCSIVAAGRVPWSAAEPAGALAVGVGLLGVARSRRRRAAAVRRA